MSLRRAGTGRTIGIVSTINDPQLPPLQIAQAADTPLGHWLMQETSGSECTDASGNGHHGVYTGVTLAQSPLSGQGLYSVTMGRADITYGAWMNVDSYTAEVLVYPTNVAGTSSPMGRNVSGDGLLWTWNNPGQTTYLYNNSGTPFILPAGTAIAANTPYLLALRWDSGSNKGSAWINGVKSCEIATTGTANKPTINMGIGSVGGGTYQWAGRESFAAYYGTALSDARLLAHAQAAGLA